jgi:predicted phosphate transport protein (TIGR00153 family)
MSLFWKKQVNVEKLIDKYFAQCDSCFQLFDKAFKVYEETGLTPAFEAATQAVHKAESSADDLRREIEHTLYGRALLPESRGDILGLLEAFDRLPNMAETVLQVIHCQRIVIPEDLVPAYSQLVEINVQSYNLARKSVDNLMSNPRVTLHSTKEVDEKESESDRAERQIICDIFDRAELDNGMKLILKEVVLLIGSISDRAEGVADRIGIIAIKRQI